MANITMKVSITTVGGTTLEEVKVIDTAKISSENLVREFFSQVTTLGKQVIDRIITRGLV